MSERALQSSQSQQRPAAASGSDIHQKQNPRLFRQGVSSRLIVNMQDLNAAHRRRCTLGPDGSNDDYTGKQ